MKKSHWGDRFEPGPERDKTTVRVQDLMTSRVVTVTRHQTIGHARELMRGHGIHSMPVVDSEGEPVGIVTSSDMLEDQDDSTKLGLVMTREVVRISPFAAPQVAAAMMRKHHIHHLVVTNEQRVVGMLSSFDLLALLEDKRFALRGQGKAKAAKKGKKTKRDREVG